MRKVIIMKNQKSKRNYFNIRNLNDIDYQKRILKKKLKIRKKILNVHINDLNDDISADYIYRQSLKALKIENGLMELVPRFFNSSNGKKKGFLISVLGALGAGITSLFIFNSSKKNNTAKSNK